MRGSDIAVRMAMIALVVEAAFLLGFFFPPPSAFALALTRQNRPRAGFTTNGNKSALVQAVRLQAPAVGTPSKMESSGRISTAMAVNSSLVFISFSNVQPSTRQGRRGRAPGRSLRGLAVVAKARQKANHKALARRWRLKSKKLWTRRPQQPRQRQTVSNHTPPVSRMRSPRKERPRKSNMAATIKLPTGRD